MIKRSLSSTILAAAVLLSGAIGLAQAQVAIPPVPPAPPKPPFAKPEDAIVARRAAWKAQGQIADAMNKTIQAGGDTSGFAADAQWMADWGKQIPTMFPAGSETGDDTKALPAIWSNKAGFDQKAADCSAAAGKLAQLASAKDEAGFAAQFKVMGGTCGACHREFRAK